MSLSSSMEMREYSNFIFLFYELLTGMSGGAIAGVVIGVILGVLVLGVIVVLGLSYMGVINGPIATRQSTPSSSSSSSSKSKGFGSSGFGFTNNLYDNPEGDGSTAFSGDSVAYHAEAEA